MRVRHGVGDGSDIGRIKRQQAFIGALVAKVLSSGTLTRFDRLVRFLNAATKSLTTDIPNIKEMAKVGLQFKNIGLKRIRFITVPFVYSTAQPGRVEWTEDAATLWKRIANDQPLGKLRDGSIGANQVPSGTPSGSASSSSSEQPQRRARARRAPPRRPTPSRPPLSSDRVAVRHLVAERRRVDDGDRRELRRPRLRRPLLVTEQEPESRLAAQAPAGRGLRRRAARHHRRRAGPGRGVGPAARARRHLAQGAGAAAPRRLASELRRLGGVLRTARRAGRGSPGAAGCPRGAGLGAREELLLGGGVGHTTKK